MYAYASSKTSFSIEWVPCIVCEPYFGPKMCSHFAFSPTFPNKYTQEKTPPDFQVNYVENSFLKTFFNSRIKVERSQFAVCVLLRTCVAFSWMVWFYFWGLFNDKKFIAQIQTKPKKIEREKKNRNEYGSDSEKKEPMEFNGIFREIPRKWTEWNVSVNRYVWTKMRSKWKRLLSGLYWYWYEAAQREQQTAFEW